MFGTISTRVFEFATQMATPLRAFLRLILLDSEPDLYQTSN